MNKKNSFSFAGQAAIVSGIVGIIAFGILIYALVAHWDIAPGEDDIRFRAHDLGVILQFLLMFPVLLGLRELLNNHSKELSQGIFLLGLVAVFFTVLLLTLNFVKLIADVLYMVPQGIFGAWLIVVNWRTSGILPRGLRRLGIVSGIGLALVGTYPLLYVLFVDTVILHGPVPKDYVDPETSANIIAHIILLIGTFMGVTTYPIWSIIFGRKLLMAKHVSDSHFM